MLTSVFVLANLLAADARAQGSDSKSAIQSEPGKPNFAIIMTDDQGYQDLGCYGSPDIKTPRIDQMARERMKFTSFYARSDCLRPCPRRIDDRMLSDANRTGEA